MLKKEKQFAAARGTVRKSIESVFGVRYQKFKLFFEAFDYQMALKKNKVTTSAIIIHNMIEA